jgi:hypothetical protein
LFIRALLLVKVSTGVPWGPGPGKANYLNNIQKEINGKEKKWHPENREKDLRVWLRFYTRKKSFPQPPGVAEITSPAAAGRD